MRQAFDHFQGMIPARSDHKLQPGRAAVARNTRLWSRDVQPIKSLLDVVRPTLAGTKLSIYLMASSWLHWIFDVDVSRSPLGDLFFDEGRIHYTGHYNPKSTDETIALTGGGSDYPIAYYKLGLPPPVAAPGVTPPAGSGDTRSYLYTFLTEWGEEGPPSSVTTDEGATSGNWTISGFEVPTNTISISSITHSGSEAEITLAAEHHGHVGEYFSFNSIGGAVELNGKTLPIKSITNSLVFKVTLASMTAYTSGGNAVREAQINTTGLSYNIYRTDANGDFRFVANHTVTTSYTDSVADANLGSIIPSTTWIHPPPDAKGLISLPNGILACFEDNELAMCEPYQPHAWPTNYRLTMSHEIVGLGSWGNTIVVVTKGPPQLVVGVHPLTMTQTKLDYEQAGASKRSIASLTSGVVYASCDGLVYIGEGGPRLITRELLKEPEWALYNPATIIGAVHDDRYYGFYTSGGEASDESAGFVFDPLNPENSWSLLNYNPSALYQDIENDALYLMASDGVIRQLDAGGSEETFTFQSGVTVFPKPTALTAFRVRHTTRGQTQADIDAEIAAAVATLDDQYTNFLEYETGALGDYHVGQFPVAGGPYDALSYGISTAGSQLTFSLYRKKDSDGTWVLQGTKSVTDQKPFRLRGGQKSSEYYWTLSGRFLDVHRVEMASSMSELALL